MVNKHPSVRMPVSHETTVTESLLSLENSAHVAPGMNRLVFSAQLHFTLRIRTRDFERQGLHMQGCRVDWPSLSEACHESTWFIWLTLHIIHTAPSRARGKFQKCARLLKYLLFLPAQLPRAQALFE